MRIRCSTLLLLAGAAAVAAGGPLPLDATSALDLARTRAPGILAARAEVTVAAGEAESARAWRHNPELAFEAGPRHGDLGTTPDRFLSLTQPLDLGFNGRGARIAAAAAGARAVDLERRGTVLDILADVARAHLLALHARDRQAIAGELVAVAERLADVAQRRHEAGEVGILDSQVAAVTLAGARVTLLRAEADAADAMAELKRLLGLEVDREVELAGEVSWPAPPDLAAVRTAASLHPALAAHAARTEQSGARLREAAAAGRPEFAISAGAGREERSDLLTFGLTMSLPVLNTGGGERRAAAAADTLARLQQQDARRRLDSRVTGAWHRHRNLQAALRTYLAEAVAAQASSVQLVEESYLTGKIDLGEVLAVQRELLAARVELANLRLEAALAAVDVRALAALPLLADASEGEMTP
ncbi:MAG: TolC family protein [Candidatus Krumholzibacteriia bacterium]